MRSLAPLPAGFIRTILRAFVAQEWASGESEHGDLLLLLPGWGGFHFNLGSCKYIEDLLHAFVVLGGREDMCNNVRFRFRNHGDGLNGLLLRSLIGILSPFLLFSKQERIATLLIDLVLFELFMLIAGMPSKINPNLFAIISKRDDL